MNHHQPLHSIDIDTRLVTVGAVLTAAGAVVACTGMGVMAVAVFAAGRRMVRAMDVPPAQQAAMKWRQARRRPERACRLAVRFRRPARVARP
ncbi:hypothetical protein ACR6C2_25435 [Streptomyces sp. INA 01156]